MIDDQRDENPQAESDLNHNSADMESPPDSGDSAIVIHEEAPSVELALESAVEARRAFEALSLSEVIAAFFRAPGETAQQFWSLAQEKAPPTTETLFPDEARLQPRVFAPARVSAPRPRSLPMVDVPMEEREISAWAEVETQPEQADEPSTAQDRTTMAIQLLLYLLAFIIVWLGTTTMAGSENRSEEIELAQGMVYALVGMGVWALSEVIGSWSRVQTWLVQRTQPTESPMTMEQAFKPDGLYLPSVHPARVFMLLIAAVFVVLAWRTNLNNEFTAEGALSWIASITLTVAAFAPASWGTALFSGWWRRRPSRALLRNPTLWTLLAIVLVGAWFRFDNLTGTQQVPPEMTSDHVEKLLDAYYVAEGNSPVFFPNNGGREPFQFYLLATVARLPGFGYNFFTLKFVTVIEGLIQIPLLFWMGRELIGRDNRKLGTIVGLVLAALVAVSYWHVTLSRMGLRIVLTVMITALLLIWLARGMRENRRGYFILAGLMLGVGLYMYQAVRMLPVVVIAAGALMLLAWLWGLIFKRGEARPTAGDGLRIVYHFSVLVIVSAVVFVPLFAYSLQYPELFWMRTAGRLLGDDVITETDAAGNIIQRSPTQAERDAAFNANMATLASNIRNALLMYNWKGDVAWISAASNYPAMDPFTGALLLVGIPAWGARMVRRRDPVDWLIPLALFIMLLPSALSIAFPIENPSATRTSGTIPTAYLIAALPLSLIALLVWRLVEGNIGRVLAGLMVACVVVGALLANRHTYFFLYRAFYMDASLPYSEAGRVLRGFAESDGGYGNAFMIGYPYWWDDRALWLEAGIPDFHNGINTDNTTIAEYVVRAATCTEGLYMLRPDRGLLFFLSDQDTENLAELGRLFPEGRSERRESYQPNDAYVLFRVPSLGVEGWQSFAERNAPQAVCP